MSGCNPSLWSRPLEDPVELKNDENAEKPRVVTAVPSCRTGPPDHTYSAGMEGINQRAILSAVLRGDLELLGKHVSNVLVCFPYCSSIKFLLKAFYVRCLMKHKVPERGMQPLAESSL